MYQNSITDYIITSHANFEMKRRGITEAAIQHILENPEQGYSIRPGRVVLQSKLRDGKSGKIYLVRVFVDIDRTPAEVVTAYQTSKISKYWRPEP
jgi:hypothetical protein